MKTIVYQSFRTENVPSWIETCMASVRRWAELKGFAYRFWDDSFFDYIPSHLRQRASVHKCLMSDYARVCAAKELLESGYDRTIWVDADALIFDPENFKVDVSSGYAFCREVWLHRTVLRQPQFKLTVNNSVTVFCRDQQLIDFYLDSSRGILASDRELNPFSIGTDWLVGLRRIVDFPLLNNVGIFGPEMAFRYFKDDGKFLRPYLAYQTGPIAAANLCLSKIGQVYHFSGSSKPWTITHETARELIDRLLADRGASLNRWFAGPYNARGHEFARPLSRYLALKESIQNFQHALKITPAR
jgi:hypothetical protein